MELPRVQLCLLLVGPGWSERGETIALAEHVGGWIYSELGMEQMVQDITELCLSLAKQRGDDGERTNA